MKKRMLSLALALVMLLSLLPTAAFALDGPAHSHDGWTAVTMDTEDTSKINVGGEKQDSNTLPAGSYCLDEDLTVALTVTGEVSLCLNGHTVTVGSGHAVTVNSGASLILWDCAADSTGTIAYTGTSSSYYGIYNLGTLTLHSGAVEGAYWGVCNGPNSTFTMTGGSVTGKDASSGYGVYNYSPTSVFRLSGGSVSGGKYGIYNNDSGSQVYLSGAPSVEGRTAGIYTRGSSSYIYADDGADTPYSGDAITLAYSSLSNGNTAVYHVTEGATDKFTLTGSISDNYELKFSAQDNALQIQGKPQTLTWYDINEGQLTGGGYPASHPYGAYLRTSELPNPPAVDGKLFLGWLYKEDGDSNWSTDYWSDYSPSIRSATSFKADYINGFPGGSGTADDPYQIAADTDLQTLSTLVSKDIAAYNNSDVWYQLTADIDLSALCGQGNSWTPIGRGEGNYYAFKANLDGSGKTISNLYINTDRSYQGLFYKLSGATVKNLTITGSVAAGGDYYGALAGEIADSTVENVDVTGVTLTPYGYTTDGNRIMAHKVDNNGSNTIHIQGNYKNNWIQTTYARAGYEVATTPNLKGAVTAEAEFINGGKYVQLSYTVKAGETAITDGKLAVHADVQIGDNDFAAVEAIQDAAGEVIGLKMVDTHSNKSGCLSQDAQFNLYFDGTGGVTPVDTYWFGKFNDRDKNNSTYGYIYFAPLNDDTKSSPSSSSLCTYEQVDGVYTRLTDTDSGFAVSWQNINLDPGQSKTYSFILGVGEKADPPQWSGGNAVSLTLAADVAQNNRLVNVSAKVKDAAGLTDTLYYGVDGGDGEILGSVEADGSTMKSITGQLDLSGYREGSYVFSFWVVNSKGAASASVEREITITADGIRGLDGDVEAGYGISGTVEDHANNPVGGATVKLMKGREQIGADFITGADGKYTFTGVAPGSYNVVAAKDDKTMTILVKVVNKSLKDQDLSMPGEDVNSVLDVKDTTVPGAAADVTKVVAGGLNKVAEAVKTANSTAASVTVTMTVEARDEAKAAGDEKTEIEQIKAAAPGKTLEYLAINVEQKIVNGISEAVTPVTDTGDTVIEIVVPYDFSGKTDVTVYRYHGTEAKSLKKEATKARGTFRLDEDNGLIHIYATMFSTYAIGYTPDNGGNQPQPPSGGGYVPSAAYPVELPASTPGGKVTASHKSASSGTTVTLTLAPDGGYEIGGVTVTDQDGKTVAVTGKGDGEYTFTMPGGKVIVKAEFTKSTGGYADCPKDDSCPIRRFTDADPAAWYHDGVHYCVENGLMSGYGNGLFGPNDNLSRAQFAQILHNREGWPAVNYLMRFADVPEGAWYTEAVRWAAAQGVVNGCGNGKFGPNDNITREQLAVMLWRYAGSPAATEKELHFTDADKASGYALEALRWAVENGIINGKSGGILDPQGLATRAEAAQILKNYLEGK